MVELLVICHIWARTLSHLNTILMIKKINRTKKLEKILFSGLKHFFEKIKDSFVQCWNDEIPILCNFFFATAYTYSSANFMAKNLDFNNTRRVKYIVAELKF